MNDRELQLSIIQIALFRQSNIKFDCPLLCKLFKSISAKNFSQVIKHWPNAIKNYYTLGCSSFFERS